jgi:CubicO group peptidase (beta-lactamase class C family)
MNSIARLTGLLEQFVADGLPGCACRVTRGKEVIYELYAGLADISNNKPIESGTIYRIHSLSKVVTCLTALTFFEQGAFLLEEPVADYLPEFRHMEVIHEGSDGDVQILPARNPIRIRDLFTHTAGLTYPGEDSRASRQQDALVVEMEQHIGKGQPVDTQMFIRALARLPLAFEPGTRWVYGFSTDVLGALIEILAGAKLSQVMKDRIFDPLEMHDTSFRLDQKQIPRLCKLYNRSADGRLSEDPGEDFMIQPGSALESGGSGLLSTLEDFSRFTHALAMGGELEGRCIIGRKTIDLMRANQLNPRQLCDFDTSRPGYGYGLGVRTMLDLAAAGSNGSLGEFGWSGLAGPWIMADPQERLSAVYMQQMMPNQLDIHAPKLRAAIYGAI